MSLDDLPEVLRERLKNSEAQYVALTQALGKFSMEFVALEADIDRAIHELLGLEPEVGHAVTSSIMSVSTRLDILWNLASSLPLKKLHRSVMLKAVDATGDLNSYRNWLFHSPWNAVFGWADYLGVREDGEHTHVKRRMLKSGKSKKWQRKNFKASEIDAQTAECRKVRMRLGPVLERLARNRIARTPAADLRPGAAR